MIRYKNHLSLKSKPICSGDAIKGYRQSERSRWHVPVGIHTHFLLSRCERQQEVDTIWTEKWRTLLFPYSLLRDPLLPRTQVTTVIRLPHS